VVCTTSRRFAVEDAAAIAQLMPIAFFGGVQ